MAKFDGLKEYRKSGAATEGRQTKRAGKRSDPQWEQTTVFLKKDAKRKALRRLEDSGKKRDLSELLQSLLDGFLVKEIPF